MNASNELITSVVTVLLAIVGVALIATLVSKNANTTAVISAGASGFSQSLGTALSPVTGQNFTGSGGASLPLSNI